MEIGQSINGYVIIGVDGHGFTTKGAGLSKWTFATKDGRTFFMKEFLTPKYPVEGCPGGPELKAKKKLECDAFQKLHLGVKKVIDPCIHACPHLIHTVDFFRVGAKYYKITKKVKVHPLSPIEISIMTVDHVFFFLKSLCESISVLHNAGFVHGDLKIENILIEKSGSSYKANLIDYDNCYVSGFPPAKDKLVGDLPYYSPELENYVLGTSLSGRILTSQSDIFALGLLFCQYLTGDLPPGIPEGKYASNVVNEGNIIRIGTKKELPLELVNLVNLMLLRNPTDRPTIGQIITVLNKASGKNIVQTGRLIINKGLKK